jgi:methylenetetrahydrofolate dehydrogenase (NADP+)/methenyltetrahydrofolate cyclohydrolase
MSAKLLDGETLAAKIREGLKAELNTLKTKGVTPHLVAIQVGENPASKVYIGQQKKSCEEMGFKYSLKQLSPQTTEPELEKVIGELNQEKDVTGIILQMPLPQQINTRKIQRAISPVKDVEGIHPANIGKLVYGDTRIAPCTAMGAMELFKTSGVSLKGKETVIVGHSEIVGKPLTLLLLQSQLESATPTVCHIATVDLSFHTKRADVLFVAVGKAGLIRGSMLKQGVIIIDIGINRVPAFDKDGKPILDDKGNQKKKIVGDVNFEEAVGIASYISPVPGGVGPLTVTMLLKNCIECAKEQL